MCWPTFKSDGNYPTEKTLCIILLSNDTRTLKYYYVTYVCIIGPICYVVYYYYLQHVVLKVVRFMIFVIDICFFLIDMWIFTITIRCLLTVTTDSNAAKAISNETIYTTELLRNFDIFIQRRFCLAKKFFFFDLTN